MPTFTNQENQAFVLHPPGDYVFQVTGIETGIQGGTGTTAGSPYWELKLAIEGNGGVVFERLIDHPSCNWKIDTFLKCTGAAPKPGASFEFDEDAAAASGCLYINPIGLRGHCHLIVDEFQKAGSTEKRKKNKVGTFHTDKPKLPRAESPTPAPAPAAAPATTAETDDIPF